MMDRRTMLALILGTLLAAAPAGAAEKPTGDQVKNLTLEAAKLLQSRDLEQARRTFHADGPFRFGEIYVNVIDFAGTWKVYPPRPAGVGQSVINVKDPDGRFIVLDVLAFAKEEDEGWVEYRWLDAASNEIEPKLTYVKQVPGKDIIVYVGMYREGGDR